MTRRTPPLGTLVGGVALLALYLGIPAMRGALGIARNDDWTYYRSLFTLVETGQFQADPFARASMVGQLIPAWPVVAVFGENLAVLQVCAAIGAVVSVLVLHALVSTFLDRWPALLVTLTFALSPLLMVLSATFMTDLAALVVQVLALAAGALALRGERFRWGWWLTAAALAIWAFTIREYAVAGVVALGAAALWTRWRSDRIRFVALAVGVMVAALAVCVAFFQWRTHLPNAGVQGRVAAAEPLWVAVQVVTLVFTLSLVLLPAAVLAAGRAWQFARRTPLVAVPLVALFVALLLWAKTLPTGTFVANFIRINGPYSETLYGPEPVVYPESAWILLEVGALIGAILIALVALSALTVAGRRAVAMVRDVHPDPTTTKPGHRTAVLLALHGAMVLTVTVTVSIVTDANLFDRYLIAAVPGIAAALAYSARGTRADSLLVHRVVTVASVVALVAHTTLGIVISDTAATFDGAKWKLGRSVVASGVPANELDGGYEWWGFHQPDPITGLGFGGEHGDSLWFNLFPGAKACVRSEYWSRDAERQGVIDEVRATTLAGYTYRLVAVDIEGTHSCPTP